MKAYLLALLLISASLSIKIKIRTPKSGSSGPGMPAPGGWSVNRSCGAVAPNVEMGSLFSLYAEQLYSIFNDPINELLLVKHESQVVAGMNRRMIFRVRDRQTNDKLYIGISIYVDLQGGVRITGYLESFVLQDIIAALGFTNSKLFRYRCNGLSDAATGGFDSWARTLFSGGTGSFTQTGPMDPLDNFDQYGNNNQSNYNPNYQNPHQHSQPPVHQNMNQDPFGGSDSPFEEKTININIEGTRPDGSKFLIGSSRPKKSKP